MSSSQNIARPRPVSAARRKISLQMGLQNGRIPKDQQYSRARSEPNLKILVPDLSGLAASVNAGPSASDLLTNQTSGGSDPILSSDVLQPVTTTLPSPLLPVFSALSTAPLQPQLLATSPPPSTNIPATTTNNDDDNNDDSESTDKYAALASLDSAFNDPANIPATTVDWSNGKSQSLDEEPETETSGHDGTESRTSGVTSPEHHVQGGINWNSTGGNSIPTTPTTTTTHNDDDSEEVDKYAALADPASTTSIDWGTPQPSDEESAAETSEPNAAESGNSFSGSSAGVMSPCSPSPAPQTATPAAMLATCVQPAPFLTNGYCNPATQYGLLATGQPGFSPSPVGNNGVYGYQQIPTHNTAFLNTLPPVGFQGFPAYMAMGSQGFPVHMEGAVAHVTSSSSSHPFTVSSPWSGHASLCQS